MAKSDSERRALEEKLNKELQEFIASRKPVPYADGWSEDNWEQEMQQHPMFMSEVPTDGSELPPLVQAIQQLKYDPAENTAEELAENYKEDGNENFRLKKYRWAVDSYTAGLKQNCSNSKLNATLFTNRAAAHYHIENYRSAYRDVQFALKLESTHQKALVRGAMCCKQLQLYAECVEWCDITLKLDPKNKNLMDLREEALKMKKIAERDLRKKEAKEKKDTQEKDRLERALKERGVVFRQAEDRDRDDEEEEGDGRVSHPALGEVHLDVDGRALVWPVIFVYPEHNQTDFVQEFHEENTFGDHLEVMFGGDQDVDWDVENKYSPDSIQIYFEDFDEGSLVPVAKYATLKEALSHKKFRVSGKWPTFHLVVKGSDFEGEWLRRFKMAVVK